MSAALTCLRDSRKRAMDAIAMEEGRVTELDTNIRGARAELDRKRTQVTEIEAAILSLGGTLEG